MHEDNLAPLSQYDVVRVVSILDMAALLDQTSNCRRMPRVGDLATILEVYSDPFGFELECTDPDGYTVWLGGYSLSQLQLARHCSQS